MTYNGRPKKSTIHPNDSEAAVLARRIARMHLELKLETEIPNPSRIKRFREPPAKSISTITLRRQRESKISHFKTNQPLEIIEIIPKPKKPIIDPNPKKANKRTRTSKSPKGLKKIRPYKIPIHFLILTRNIRESALDNRSLIS